MLCGKINNIVANALAKMGLFKCDGCKFSALQGSHLKMHVRRIHELRCDICEFVPPYSTKEQLAHHISTVHAGFSYKGACTYDVHSSQGVDKESVKVI